MDAGLEFQIQQDYMRDQIASDDNKNLSDRQYSNNSVNPLVKCQTCHEGFLGEKFTTCSYIWCLLCFPCGIICCMANKKRVCGKCKTEFTAT